MKKLFAFMLVCALLMVALPALADNVRTSGPYTYEIKGNGTITITDFDWSQNEGDVFIPNMIDGYTVTAIGDEAFMDESAKAVAVNIPNSVKSIGKFAFKDTNIKEINIHNDLQMIGDGAFVGCPNCQFKLSPNHSKFAVIEGALYNKPQKELIAYYGNTETFAIPEGILSIASYALYDNPTVNILFPSTLKSIGDYALYDVYIMTPEGGLLPDGLQSIGDYAFANAGFYSYNFNSHKSPSLNIPDSVETIGVGAFSNMSSSSKTHPLSIGIEKTSALRHIPQDAFRDTCGYITIWGKIDTIGDYAFSGNTANVQYGAVDIRELAGVSSIGEGAFYMGDYYSRSVLHGVSFSKGFPAKVTTIPKFFNHPATLPDTVEAISSQAFTYQVEDFYLPASIEDIATDAFPKGSTFVVEAGSYAEFWCSENGFGYTIEGQDALDWLN